MRVRAKWGKSDTEYEVLDIGEWYYVARVIGNSDPVALSKQGYEPVPETRWEDITAQCEVKAGTIYHKDARNVPDVTMCLQKIVGWVQAPYRLRLVNHVLIVNGALIVERETC